MRHHRNSFRGEWINLCKLRVFENRLTFRVNADWIPRPFKRANNRTPAMKFADPGKLSLERYCSVFVDVTPWSGPERQCGSRIFCLPAKLNVADCGKSITFTPRGLGVRVSYRPIVLGIDTSSGLCRGYIFRKTSARSRPQHLVSPSVFTAGKLRC